ncbi:MAG: lytic murein transglycosylase, partial [Bacteroidota bacterium]
DWAKRGIVDMSGRPVRDYGAARILRPAGQAGASFMVFKNFDVIKRYNWNSLIGLLRVEFALPQPTNNRLAHHVVAALAV